MKMTSLSYVPTSSRLIMVSQMILTSLRFLFPQAPLDTLKNTEKQIQFLSGFQPVPFFCLDISFTDFACFFFFFFINYWQVEFHIKPWTISLQYFIVIFIIIPGIFHHNFNNIARISHNYFIYISLWYFEGIPFARKSSCGWSAAQSSSLHCDFLPYHTPKSTNHRLWELEHLSGAQPDTNTSWGIGIAENVTDRRDRKPN